jgi:DNA-binding transcriptional ArsR family regulator
MRSRRRDARDRDRRSRDLPTSAELVQALGHPVRVEALTIFIDRISSPKEIARDLGRKLSNVSYHVRVLERLGLIEIAEEEAVRGSVAHFYRAIEPEMLRALLGQFQFPVPSEKTGGDA